jgi:hypothetical protein
LTYLGSIRHNASTAGKRDQAQTYCSSTLFGRSETAVLSLKKANIKGDSLPQYFGNQFTGDEPLTIHIFED